MPDITTGNPTIDAILKVVGALYSLFTAVSALPLPKAWSATQLLARVGGDVRNVRGDTTATASKTTAALLVLFAALGCQSLKDTAVPTVVDCAPDREYVIEQLEAVLLSNDAFEVLDRVKKDKGREFVMCALQKFAEKSASEAVRRLKAQAYIEREALKQ